MNDFVKKYKNSTRGVSKKQQNKDDKKAVTKALHQTFKMAMQGQVAGINHNGTQYLMMRQDIFNKIIQNGGKLLLTEEQKEFNKTYQVLLHMMQSLNIEDAEESALFDEIDQFTFDFSQHMNNPDGKKTREKVLKEFNDFVATSELLTKMEKNLRNQLFQDQKETEEVENNGKLT